MPSISLHHPESAGTGSYGAEIRRQYTVRYGTENGAVRYAMRYGGATCTVAYSSVPWVYLGLFFHPRFGLLAVFLCGSGRKKQAHANRQSLQPSHANGGKYLNRNTWLGYTADRLGLKTTTQTKCPSEIVATTNGEKPPPPFGAVATACCFQNVNGGTD